jgi:amino acid transporter
MARDAAAVEEPQRGTLRRELRFWEAIALSIGIMAPTAAMALNGVAPAGLVGRAVPLAFLFAAIAIAFVSYAFIRLTRHFNHAGSAYALTGATLGPRAGFFTGWAQMGTYAFFTAASIAEVGLFGTALFDGTGIWHGPSWIVISLIAAAVIAAVAYAEVKIATRSLLIIEALSVTLITILIVWIYVKVIGGSAPNGQGFSLKAFSPPAGVGIGAIAYASVFGFLSWAGFEGASALGEETNNPRRNIPFAIAGAVAFTGVFYVIVMYAQSLGFGLGANGVKAFSSSGAPLGDLSKTYIDKGFADAVNFGAMVSAFASALGTAAASSRILFALGRDGFISRRLGDASARTGAPANALAIVMVAAVGTVIGLRINGTTSTNVFFYMGTIGVLSLLVAYIVTNLGAAKFLLLDRREHPWQIVIFTVAIGALVYVEYKNVHGIPYPYDKFPYVVLGWLALAVAIIVAFPRLVHRIGANLMHAEGIERPPPAD